MSACKSIGPLLDGYHDGELDAPERQRVQHHIERCRSCRRDLDSLEAVGGFVRAAIAGTHEPDFWNGIARQLPAQRVPVRRAPPRRRWMRPFGAAAAVAAAAAVVLLVPETPLPVSTDSGARGVVRSVYSHDRPVVVLEGEVAEEPTIIWLMDESAQPEREVERSVRI
jgi:anti-sigma factor RsiW